MRRLTVLSVAYPHAPVGPDAVGGAEQVVTALDRALVDAGHRSIVLACAGSQAHGELLGYPSAPPGEISLRPYLDQALRTRHVDVVHMHGIDFHAHLPAPGVPVLATLHLPPAWYPPEALAPTRPQTWVHGVSQSQAALIPHGPRVLPPIGNGVPVEALASLRRRRCSYALMLARICPEKGVHLALEAAHRAGVPLLIGGEVFPHAAHQAYFRDQVAPLLDRRRRYLGPLDFDRKRRLLAGARCLLVPSLVAETSSLVAMEAASCGTPVIGFHAGALPEIIEHGRTGLLVDDMAGMAAAIPAIASVSAEACLAVARRRFDHGQMAAAYLERYAALANPRGSPR